MTSLIFKLENITYSVDGQDILSNINLDIRSNEIIAIVGPSGAGKSSLLRLLNYLNSPTAGNIYFNNKILTDYDLPSLRKKIGMVFQSPTMIKGSVKENLILSQKWNNDVDIDESILTDILEKVNLDAQFLNKDAQSLSGGEQQRVALARVLLNKPNVLLLDEPTANLDPQLADKILQLVYQLHLKLNLTVLLVSHNYKSISQFVKRAVFMIGGKIVEVGSGEIITSPRTKAAQKFLAKELE